MVFFSLLCILTVLPMPPKHLGLHLSAYEGIKVVSNGESIAEKHPALTVDY